MKIVKIKIDNNETVISLEVFRRVLTSARNTLTRLKADEGPTFPQIDRQALQLIHNLQYDHKELI